MTLPNGRFYCSADTARRQESTHASYHADSRPSTSSRPRQGETRTAPSISSNSSSAPVDEPRSNAKFEPNVNSSSSSNSSARSPKSGHRPFESTSQASNERSQSGSRAAGPSSHHAPYTIPPHIYIQNVQHLNVSCIDNSTSNNTVDSSLFKSTNNSSTTTTLVSDTVNTTTAQTYPTNPLPAAIANRQSTVDKLQQHLLSMVTGLVGSRNEVSSSSSWKALLLNLKEKVFNLTEKIDTELLMSSELHDQDTSAEGAFHQA